MTEPELVTEIHHGRCFTEGEVYRDSNNWVHVLYADKGRLRAAHWTSPYSEMKDHRVFVLRSLTQEGGIDSRVRHDPLIGECATIPLAAERGPTNIAHWGVAHGTINDPVYRGKFIELGIPQYTPVIPTASTPEI